MKSSMAKTSHTGMNADTARFSRRKIGTGYLTIK